MPPTPAPPDAGEAPPPNLRGAALNAWKRKRAQQAAEAAAATDQEPVSAPQAAPGAHSQPTEGLAPIAPLVERLERQGHTIVMVAYGILALRDTDPEATHPPVPQCLDHGPSCPATVEARRELAKHDEVVAATLEAIKAEVLDGAEPEAVTGADRREQPGDAWEADRCPHVLVGGRQCVLRRGHDKGPDGTGHQEAAGPPEACPACGALLRRGQEHGSPDCPLYEELRPSVPVPEPDTTTADALTGKADAQRQRRKEQAAEGLQRLAARREQLEADLDKVRQEVEAALPQAAVTGLTYDEMADHVQLARSRVAEILREARDTAAAS